MFWRRAREKRRTGEVNAVPQAEINAGPQAEAPGARSGTNAQLLEGALEAGRDAPAAEVDQLARVLEVPLVGMPDGIIRLNWGCGEAPERGWLNSDIKSGPGIHISRDIRRGLPLETASVDYAVSIHALPEIPYVDLVPAVRELRRVLKPGGILRLALPDLDKGIQAYLSGDRDYFLVPDEHARSIGGKFVTQMLWYGWSRSMFTHDWVEEMCETAGFSRVVQCAFGETAGPWPEIVELDSRERESMFVEAVK